jgi:hypothetical protein
MQDITYDLEILLPVYNEENSIDTTLLEIHREISKHLIFQFITCEV